MRVDRHIAYGFPVGARVDNGVPAGLGALGHAESVDFLVGCRADVISGRPVARLGSLV